MSKPSTIQRYPRTKLSKSQNGRYDQTSTTAQTIDAECFPITIKSPILTN